jgi:hypothetical protein
MEGKNYAIKDVDMPVKLKRFYYLNNKNYLLKVANAKKR